MIKILHKILKITRICLGIFLIVTTLVLISFSIINYKLSYDIPPVVNIELYDNTGVKFLSYTNGRKQSYVKLDNISKHVIDAFISIEDKRFYEHQGVDFIRIGGALLADIKAGSMVQGASTITQQYVRLLYLNSNKTIKRKIYELMISMNIESKYSKDEILEGYLNSIYFDHGIYGIEDASLYYFNKKSSDLTLAEACILAAIPKGPSIYSPIKNVENNTARKNLILNELLKDGIISNEEYQIALNEVPTYHAKNPHNQNSSAPYFQDMVIKKILSMGFLNDYLYQGIKVYTTLDSKLNKDALHYIDEYHPNSDIEVAIYAIEPTTGKILTVIGGKDYQSSTYNRAVESYRQPASTIKPFLYLAALENGFNLSTTFMSEATTFYVNKDSYTPSNFKNIYPNMNVSMIYALATSDNIYAVKTHLFLGEDKLVEMLSRFKISNNALPIPSLALGTHEVTLQKLTEGYSALANLGVLCDSYMIEKITTFDDKVLFEKESPETTKVADSTDVFLLNSAMTSVFDRNVSVNMLPTGARIASLLSHPFAAKSGSTDTDNLIVGFNKDICIGIWTGYDDNRIISSSTDTSFGKSIWARTIDSYATTNNSTWYKTPDNVIGVELNPVTGFYGGFNEYTKTVYFRKNNIPWYIELLYKKDKEN